MEKTISERRDFFQKMVTIALPVVFQSLLTNSLSFVDTLMIGQLGESSIAAVALGNQMFFLISVLFFGVCSGSAIFLSQYWGAKNETNIQRVLGLSFSLAGASALLFALASLFIPRQIMHIFTTEAEVVNQGIAYLRIVGISYLFTAISQVLATALRVIGYAKIPLQVALFSLTLNAGGNYLLIFGIGPFPELGVAGAATATTISRLVEVIALLWIVYHRHPVIAIRSREAFRWNKTFLLHIIPTSMPVIINEFFWALGMATYKVAYSKMGIEAIASINVAESVGNLFFVLMMGISNATLIMIGVKIGEKQRLLALLYARRFITTALLVGLTMGIFEFLFAPLFTSFFNISDRVRELAIYCLSINAALLPIKSINMVIIVGILRSGGDTKYSMFAEMFGVWAVGVPLAFIGVFLLHLNTWQLYLLLGMEEVTKLFIGLYRIKREAWINDLTATFH
ncbi:MATE family efflux transporter [uncultured Sphaerochaeta sp.]|uniref:MATE family efflux transporter n=1 Tax=uncultured Sphaerochaeta sp. TaxID=886478 RepID=UPI0029CA5E8C|nr:MATE family efflux transporter [uncultured Sphaerochaeta sp.]